MDEAGQEQIRRFVDYVTADGFDVTAMVRNMERLKFEQIVTGKTAGEILSQQDPPETADGTGR